MALALSIEASVAATRCGGVDRDPKHEEEMRSRTPPPRQDLHDDGDGGGDDDDDDVGRSVGRSVATLPLAWGMLFVWVSWLVGWRCAISTAMTRDSFVVVTLFFDSIKRRFL